MSEIIIHTSEHEPVGFSTEELLQLAKHGNCRLIERLDFKHELLYPSYIVGVDRLLPLEKVLVVGPKKAAGKRLDYLRMLSVCLRHPSINIHSKDLFDVRFEKQTIKIKQQEDLLTPLLVVQYLRAVERVVKKGLQRGYYSRTENMTCRVKGRVLIGDTLKRNHFRNNFLQTWCKYQVFGTDTAPNRILHKTLQFIQRYTQILPKDTLPLAAKLRFLQPAFEHVGIEVELSEIEHYKPSPFYAEYTEAIRLGQLLLKRFGYQLNSVKSETYTDIPPFWIDMSKLFELYALSQLQEAVGCSELVYQANGKFGYLDFLHTAQGEEMIIDAKYKYFYGEQWYDIEDVRQLSAYARDRGLLAQLKIPQQEWSSTVLPCIIIYPNPGAPADINRKTMLNTHISQFERFYSLGLSLPMS